MNHSDPKTADVHAAAQRMLLDQGMYSSVELLVATGQLHPEDLEAWRRGEIARLDDAFAEGPAGARACLEAANDLARALGLTVRSGTLTGLPADPGSARPASADPRLNVLLHNSVHARRPSAPGGQLDLFADSKVTVATNALLEALWSKDPGESRRTRERLVALVPRHRYEAPAAVLIGMLETPGPGTPDEGAEWVHRLEREWIPAASDLFGERGGALLAPFWREAGRALESISFNPARPRRHASWAYRQSHDWGLLKRSVLRTPVYREAPVLLTDLAEAEWRLGNRSQAIEHWITLCWQAPDLFRVLIDGHDFPDPLIREAWDFIEDQVDPEPELAPAWFPAWILLYEYGLARTLAARGETSGPKRAFDVVRNLLTTPRAADANMELRRELGAIHPGLLRHYLSRLEADSLRP